MFNLAPTEMILIGVVAILLFGNRLPEVAKSVGKSWNEFKKGMRGLEDEMHNMTRTPEPTRPRRVAEDREESSGPKFDPPPAEGAA